MESNNLLKKFSPDPDISGISIVVVLLCHKMYPSH